MRCVNLQGTNTVKYHIKNALSFLQTELSKYLIALILFFSC